ncbi:MAG: transcription-repair coupling factor, partial [Burkholderiales bacterium]
MLIIQPPPAPGTRHRYRNLHGSSDALALAAFAQRTQPLVVFTETAAHAQRLAEEIRYFSPQRSVYLLPDWETLPYDHFSPHQDLISERLATLYQLTQRAFDVVLVPVTTALYRLPPTRYLAAHTFFLKQSEILDLNRLRAQLTLAGYNHVSQVLAPGEYSVRGGLVDLFPMGSALPYRIDLFGDEIDSLRTFDVDSQRSIYPVKEIRLLPAREFPMDEAARNLFRQNFRDRFEGDPSKSTIYKDVSQGIASPGIEYYLPLFFENTASLFDYLPENSTLFSHHALEREIQHFWHDAQGRYQLMGSDRERPLLAPHELFLSAEQFFVALKPYPRIEILQSISQDEAVSHGAAQECATQSLPPVQVDRRAVNPVHALQAFLQSFDGRVLIAAESPGRRETIRELLIDHGIKPALCETFAQFADGGDKLVLSVAPVTQGFILDTQRCAIITENELYALQVRQSRRREAGRRVSAENMVRDLAEIRVGDPVVHEQHGIGRYRGLVNLDLGEGMTEFLCLEYASDDKLYVPVAQLHVIGRYSGAPSEAVELHKLGSGQWEKAKRRALKQAHDTAAELLDLYAKRAARQGHAFAIEQHHYDAFAASFEFEETPDQAAAISAVMEDMRRGKPADRLVCGDVGFGKTEVALRAAFLATSGGKQVAVLVPTTLLAEQHFLNFSDRFADWPVRVAELTRFRSPKEQVGILKAVKEGKIDIVIGTHRLLQKDVQFKELGLVIIDEEHLFGVRQKERFKALRAEVDVLTLTAT